MAEYSLLISFLIAIAIGALIGLEREYAQEKRKFKTYAGIRTFTLISLLGALSAFFAQRATIWLLLVALVAVAFIAIIFSCYFSISY